MTYWDARADAERLAAELHAENFLNGQWKARNGLNVPGPFYGADTDTCLAGFAAAPRHVLFDEHGMEFVWRQPRNLDEVRAVLDAAYQDPFEGYGCDGDDHWTPELVQEWWDGREQIDERLAKGSFPTDECHAEALLEARDEYRRYIAEGLYDDLRRYAEWLSGRARLTR